MTILLDKSALEGGVEYKTSLASDVATYFLFWERDKKPPTATNSQRSRGEGVSLIVETEYGYLYNGVLYATYTEAEHAKADN